jgi:hypothetical protein
MATEIITREDLQEFRQQLLGDIQQLLQQQPTTNPPRKEWLKSSEVRKLLGISAGTLQQLCLNGTLTYTKVGGIHFFRYQDLAKALEPQTPSRRR